MSTVTEIVAALQELHEDISGVASAPTEMPGNLDQVDLPVALVWPEACAWDPQAIGLKRQERTYVVRVFVQPVGQGIMGPDAGYQDCMTLLEAFGQAYLDDLTLGNVVECISGIEDSGVSGGGFELGWGNVPYWGFVFRVTIVEKSS